MNASSGVIKGNFAYSLFSKDKILHSIFRFLTFLRKRKTFFWFVGIMTVPAITVD
jgi:hypothetical protein